MRAATVTDFLPILLEAIGEESRRFDKVTSYLVDLHLQQSAHATTLPSLLATAAVLGASLLLAAFNGPVVEDVLSKNWSPLSMLTDYSIHQVILFFLHSDVAYL